MAEAPAKQAKRLIRRVVTGVVTAANRTPKTIRVEVQYQTRHSKYGKTLNRVTKYHAHDEKSEAKVGDQVELMECRPMSKLKTWRLVRIVQRGPQD
jgi:small subunit ribosomal protein S17